MAAQSLNNADLSKAAGIPYYRLDPWFRRDNAKPNAADLESVADALGTQVHFLLTGKIEKAPTEREWIINLYDRLPADKRVQLQSFARFLASDQTKASDNEQRRQKPQEKDDPSP